MKVLIVDDELIIRDWLSYVVGQSNLVIDQIYTAINGEEALTIIENESPDVAFVDIVMPGMDGLQLLEKIRQKNTRIQVIILSSHSNFEYARLALKYNTSSYILKTEVTKEIVEKVLREVQNELIQRRVQYNNSLDIISMKKTALLRQIMKNEIEVTKEALDLHGISIKNLPLFAVAFRAKQDSSYSGYYFSCNSKITHTTGFIYTDEINIVISNIEACPSALQQSQVLRHYLNEITQKNQLSVGVSRVMHGWKELRNAIYEAIYNLEVQFYEKEHQKPFQIHLMEEQKQYQKDICNTFCLKVRSEVANGNIRAVAPLFELFFQEARNMPFLDIHRLKNTVIEATHILSNMSEFDKKAYSGVIVNKIEQSKAFKQLYYTTIEFVEQWSAVYSHNYSKPVDTVINYIKNHPCEELKLTDMAQLIKLRPEYFSRLFKKETGRTFVSYVCMEKLNYAAFLLREKDYRVCEVAEKIGYRNVGYFSAIFKEQFGINPFNYRTNKSD